MNCVLCSKTICNHGRLNVSGNNFTCLDCGATANGQKPSIIILPIFESNYDMVRGIPSPVCANCYIGFLKTWLEWAIDIINGYDQRLATFDDPKNAIF